MPRTTSASIAWADLLAFAATRHGVFGRHDAHQRAVTDAMLRSAVGRGAIHRVDRATFRIAGSPDSWEQRLVIACTAFCHRAVASRRSAAVFHKYEGFRPGIVEITSDQDRSIDRPGVVAHRTSRFLAGDLTVVRGVPCTDPIRTFIDLGAVVSPSRLEEILDAAESSGTIRRADLEERLAQIRVQGRNGVGAAARLIESRAPRGRNPTNGLERAFLRLVTDAGLEPPACQVPVRKPDGSLAIVDFLWIPLLFGVETDGQAYHSSRQQRARDNLRDSQLLGREIETVRFTRDQVRREPEVVVAQLRLHLARRRRMVDEGRLVVPTALAEALAARIPA